MREATENQLLRKRRPHRRTGKRPDHISSFLLKTYEIVMNPQTDDIIQFQKSGESFVVKNEQRLSQEILPNIFKHSNFSSFVRQLNMYNFKKIRNVDNLNEFSHRYFKRDQKHLLYRIQRKQQMNKERRADLTQLLKINKEIKKELNKTSDDLQSLQISFQQFITTFDILQVSSKEIKKEIHKLQLNQFVNNSNFQELLEKILQQQKKECSSVDEDQFGIQQTKSNRKSKSGGTGSSGSFSQQSNLGQCQAREDLSSSSNKSNKSLQERLRIQKKTDTV